MRRPRNASGSSGSRASVEARSRCIATECWARSRVAEDMTQETFARAWRARGELTDPAAARPWLYRIATNACLDTLRRHKRERRLWGDPAPMADSAELGPPDLEVDWLEPMPHSTVADVPVAGPNPQAIYEQAEALRLAFLACVQLLPARQRAIFLLHEVLGWSAAEVASAFAMSPQAANSQLQRARRTFGAAYRHEPKWAAAGDLDQQLATRYAAAIESRDLDAFTALLRPDARLHMPPWRAWVSGRGAIVERSTPWYRQRRSGEVPCARDRGQRTLRDRRLRTHGRRRHMAASLGPSS